MAFSMKWKPDLDDIQKSSAETPTSRLLGPIAGILPPHRQQPAPTPKATPASDGTYAYNVNWRPPSPKEVKPEPVPTHDNSRRLLSTGTSDPGPAIFRATLAKSCPEVQCFSKDAYSCNISGLICSLERVDEEPWILQLHPFRAELTQEQTLQMTRAIYSTLYAALAKSGAESMQLQVSNNLLPPFPSALQAILALGIPNDLSMPITPSLLLQTFHFADIGFLRPPFPYIRTSSFIGSQPVAHPLRRPYGLEEVYSRYVPTLGKFVTIRTVPETRGSVQLELALLSPGQSSGDRNTSAPLTVRLSWALEHARISDVDVDEYDRVLSCPDTRKSEDESLKVYVEAICHFILLDDARTRRITWFGQEPELSGALQTIGLVAAKRPISRDAEVQKTFLGTLDMLAWLDRSVRL